MAVSRGGWLNRKGSMKKGKLLTGILTGVLAFTFMAMLVPVASAKITQIEIDEPGGGEAYAVGTYYIWWHQAADTTSDSVEIWFSPDGGTTWQWVKDYTAGVTDFSATVGCTWDTGAVTVPGGYSDECMIRLVDPSGHPSDESNLFTIDKIYPSIKTAYFTSNNEMVVVFTETVDVVHPESFAVPLACASGLSGSVQYSISDTTFSVSNLTANCQCNGTTLSVSSGAVFDLAGNPLSSITAPVLPDDTPPTVAVDISPEPASATSVSFTLVFSETMATAASPVVTFGRTAPYHTVQVIGSWSGDTVWAGTAATVHMLNDAEEGLNTLVVTEVTDRCGNPLSATTYNDKYLIREFIIDKTAPSVSSVSVPTDCVTTCMPVIEVQAQDDVPPGTTNYPGVIIVQWRSSTAPTTWQTQQVSPPSTNISITLDTTGCLTDGTHIIGVRVIDAASNVSAAISSDSFTIDTTPPTVDSAYFKTDTEMVVEFSEPVKVVHPQSFALPTACASSIVEWTPSTGFNSQYTVTLSGLTAECQCTGSTLSISAGAVVDKCGNSIVAGTAAVSGDKTNPTFVEAEFLGCASMQVTFSEALSDASVEVVASFSSASISFTSTYVTTDSPNIIIVGVSPPTVDADELTYGIDDLWIKQAAVLDRCGNPISSVSPLSVKRDDTDPKVVSVSASPTLVGSGTTVQITVTFNECMDTSVDPYVTCGTATPYTTYAVPTGTWNSATQWTGSVLAPRDSEGKNGVKVADAQDMAGNPVVAREFDNVFTIDCTGPEASVISIDSVTCGGYISTATPTITVRATDDVCSVDTVQYRVEPATEWTTLTSPPMPSPASVVTVSFNLPDPLSPDSTYCIWVRARDVLGNMGDERECCFTVDTTPPTFEDAEFLSCNQIKVYFSEDLSFVSVAGLSSESCTFTEASIVTGVSTQVIINVSEATVSVSEQTYGISGDEGLNILAGAVRDLAGNPIQTITGQTVRGDTTAPAVSDVTVSPCCVSAATVSVSIVFTECMATPVTVSVGLETPYDTYPVSGSWSDTYTWEGTIPAASVETFSEGWYGIGIFDAKDRAGTPLSPTTFSDKFLVDHTAPTVQVNVTPKPVFAGEEVHINLHFSELVRGACSDSSGEPSVELSGPGGRKKVNGDWTSPGTSLCDGTYYDQWGGISTAPLSAGTYYVYIDDVYDCPAHPLSYPTPYSFEIIPRDDVPPEIKDLAPTGTISDATPTISASFEDAGSGISEGTAVMIVDGVNVTASATVATTGISYTPATALSDDVHVVEITVADKAGNQSQTTWVFTVNTIAPTVVINQPNEGDFVSGVVTIEAGVGAEDITDVHFLVDDREICLDADGSDGWTCAWDTTEESEGVHVLKAQAYDETFNSSESQPVQVTVDNTAPVAKVIDPVSGNVAYVNPGDNLRVTYTYTEKYPYTVNVKVKSAEGEVAGSTVENLAGATEPATVQTIVPIYNKPNISLGMYNLVVTITDKAGNSVTYTEENAVCIFLPKVEKVVSKKGGTVELGEGTKVGIPEGALDSDTLITVEALEPQDIPEFDVDGVTATDVARFFGPEGLVFAKLVTVTIPYTERDIAGLDENKLALYVWDGLGWYRVGDEIVNTDANTITAKVNHFSIYRLVEDTTEAAGFKVYLTKNPFLSGQGTMFVYSLPKAGKVTLKIYDATGDLVRTLLDGVSQSAGWHNVKWDGDNDFFSFVGSGLYIYRFEVKYTGGGSGKDIKPVGVIK